MGLLCSSASLWVVKRKRARRWKTDDVMSETFDFARPDPDQVSSGWTAATIGSGWEWTLTAAQVSELVSAGQTIDPGNTTQMATLHQHPPPLPSLADQISALRQHLTDGRGLELIHGLPVEDIGDDAATSAMLVVSAHLGPLRKQNAAGDLVGHVRNTGARSDDPNVRLYQTSERQTFHTDSTDVVGLLALAVAQEGGDSVVVNAAAAYHEVARRHPKLVDQLFAAVATDRRGETPAGENPWFTIPVFTWWEQRLTVMYQRQYIDSTDRFPAAPRRSDLQTAALNAFDDVCNDPTLQTRMTLQPGDMQFVHNHSLLHDRTSFVDNPARPRHLIRTWISLEGDRPLHPVFAQRFGSVIPGQRGGVAAYHEGR